jgi:hypothetical protein
MVLIDEAIQHDRPDRESPAFVHMHLRASKAIPQADCSIVVTDCPFYHCHILGAVQFQVPTQIPKITRERLERHDSARGSHKHRREKRVKSDVRADIIDDTARPDRLHKQALLLMFIAPEPAAVHGRAHDPLAASQWSLHNRHAHVRRNPSEWPPERPAKPPMRGDRGKVNSHNCPA